MLVARGVAVSVGLLVALLAYPGNDGPDTETRHDWEYHAFEERS
jgi:hypothetical protein